MPPTLLHIICGELGWLCVPMRDTGGGGEGLEESVWVFGNIIRIQYTAWKMQQMGSSLEWQLRAGCHTELQLACQSQAAPRSFLYLHIFTLLSASFYFIFSFQCFICPKLCSFLPFDLSILSVLRCYKSTSSSQPSRDGVLSGQAERKYLWCAKAHWGKRGVGELKQKGEKRERRNEDVVVYTAGLSSPQELSTAGRRFLF